jgi:ribosomal protein S18 acetylase RimI-like enzyme
VSELRPGSPARRPETARPREETVPQVDPPSGAELEAIQRHLVSLPGLDGGSVRDDAELGVVLVQGPGSGPDVSYAAMPRWGADDWPSRLAATCERMRLDGAWPSLFLCESLDRPGDLASQLEQQGWIKVSGETVMWVGHASVVPHLDPLMRIEAVQPGSIATHQALEREIFGRLTEMPQGRRDARVAALGAGQLRAWIIWLDQEPVAVARLTQGQGAAGLQGVGVMEGWRGQGYGTLMTIIATRAGMATGNRIIWLSVHDDNATARGMYERLGFQRAFGWSRWLVTEDPRPRQGPV